MKTAPASTFKIPHALIALETGVIPDARNVLRWDGTEQPFEAWRRDHTLDSAVKSSVLWFFRRTAAQIGRERMAAYLRKLDYAEDGFGGELTSFWLNGDLLVSPAEQLRFITRLVSHELPAQRTNVDIVLASFLMPAGRITSASGTHDFALDWPTPLTVRAKTGNTAVGDERVSWLVGHIVSRGKHYVFVSRVRSNESLPGTAGAALALRTLLSSAPSAPAR